MKQLVTLQVNQEKDLWKTTIFTDETKAKDYFNNLIKRNETVYFTEIKGHYEKS